MADIRKEEQKKTARVGDYSATIFLDYPDGDDLSSINFIFDLKNLINKMQPDYIYTHNLADKHPMFMWQ